MTTPLPWLRKRGELTGSQTDLASAKLYETFRGAAWQVHGPQSTRIPFLGLQPLPYMMISINPRAGRGRTRRRASG